MHAHARTFSTLAELSETELFAKIQLEIVNRYGIDGKLASEMAWDLLEVMVAVDSDLEIFDKYFLQ